ncbi:MAG: hypothetical protein JXR07_19160 [Reichenbachiella sp.]
MKLSIATLTILLIIQVSCSTTKPVQLELSALNDFKPLLDTTKYIPHYKDKQRNALAINAGKYKGKYSIANHTFEGPENTYDIVINTVPENDGESTYKLLINGKKVNEVQNPTTNDTFSNYNLSFGSYLLKPQDVISISFNSHTNGKIPEGDITAYSRGRWTHLKLSSK